MKRVSSREVGSALLASCVTADEGGPNITLQPDQLHGLAAAVAHHRLAGYVLAARAVMSAAPLPEARAIRLQATQDAANHLRTLSELTRVADAFESLALTWCVLKGPVLAEVYHRSPAIRGYGDLDLLVLAEELGQAISALERQGGVLLERNWRHVHRLLPGEVHVRMPSGAVIDLHWHLIPGRDVRETFSVPPREALDRRIDANLGSLTVPALSTEDTLLHVALHTMLSGADRLIWFKDLQSVATAVTDWDAVVRRARAWDASLVVAAALRHTVDLLDLALPVHVFSALGESRTWRRVGEFSRRATPIQRSIGGPSLHRLISRACRADLRDSLHEAVRRITAWAHEARPDHLHQSRPTDSGRSVFVPTGDDDQHRGRFLEAVTRATAN